jgi:hypothetical protein
MQGEQLPLTGEQGRVFLLTSPLIGLANDTEGLATTQPEPANPDNVGVGNLRWPVIANRLTTIDCLILAKSWATRQPRMPYFTSASVSFPA